MLNDFQITQAEAVFLAIDSGKLEESFIKDITEHVFSYNYEMWVYLIWLLNRWVLLRSNPYQLPARYLKPTIQAMTPHENLKNKHKSIEPYGWFCNTCHRTQNRRNRFCYHCGVSRLKN